MKKLRDPYPITDVYLLEMNAVDAATVTVGDLCERLTNDFDTGWGFGGPVKEFIDDFYDGKLLTDFSQQSKDDIDLVKRPSWAELAAEEIKSRQEEEEAEKIQEMHRKNLHGEEDPDYDPDAEAEEADAMMEALLGDDGDE